MVPEFGSAEEEESLSAAARRAKRKLKRVTPTVTRANRSPPTPVAMRVVAPRGGVRLANTCQGFVFWGRASSTAQEAGQEGPLRPTTRRACLIPPLAITSSALSWELVADLGVSFQTSRLRLLTTYYPSSANRNHF